MVTQMTATTPVVMNDCMIVPRTFLLRVSPP
jgi:hypothetical protein